MTTYIWTLALGVGVGVIYGLSGVRSPAPPVIALVGLLGILAGEQLVAAVKRHFSEHGLTRDWLREHAHPHMFGRLPAHPDHNAKPKDISNG